MNVKEIHMCYTTYIKLHKNKTGSTQTAIKIVLIRIYMKFIHILFFFLTTPSLGGFPGSLEPNSVTLTGGPLGGGSQQ